MQWPTCASHYKLTHKIHSWYDFVWDIGYLPHGPVHSWIGGVGGHCDKEFDAVLTNYLSRENIIMIKTSIFAMVKNMWREKVIKAPEYCSVDAPSTECKFKCAAKGTEEFNKLVEFSETYMAVGDVNISGFSTEVKAEIVETLFCTTPYWAGDHLEAASPVEASFWPIHPTMERLLQYKEIAMPFKNTEWTGSKFCNYGSTSGCRGHHPGDLTFWSTVYKDQNGSFVSSHQTNEDVRKMLRPSSYKVPYIYNNFEWSHCAEEGYHFKEI